MKYRYLLVFMILGLLTSCLKDEYRLIEEEVTPPAVVTYLKSSLEGTVYDKYGRPMSDVEVRIGSLFQKSNNQGKYCFSNIPMAKNGQVVRFNKLGHVESYAFIKPILNELLTLTSRMVEPSGNFKFSNTDEILIPFGKDGSVEIPAQAFEYQDGSNVNSDILIETIYYENLCNANCYPVNLDINTKDQLRLQTDMIIGLNVTSSSSNEKLILKQGMDIEILFPSNQILTNDMDLFQYNEQSMTWSKNDDATVISNRNYIINKLPDFLSVGLNKEYSWIIGDLRDVFGDQHYKQYHIQTANAKGVFDHVNSSSSGHFEVVWPKNKSLDLVVFNECNELVDIIRMSGISSDLHQMGEIEIHKKGKSAVVKGTIRNENNVTVKNGIVKIIPNYGSPFYTKIDSSNGQYLTNIKTCLSNEFDIEFYDLDEMKFQKLSQVHIRSGGRGKYSCEVKHDMSDYLVIKYDQNTYVLNNPDFRVEGDNIVFNYSPNLNNLKEAWVSLKIPGVDKGYYSKAEFSFFSFDQNECEVIFNKNDRNGIAQFEISSIPDSLSNKLIGEASIIGYIDYLGNRHDIHINFGINM